jgi:hypothetical protein
MTQEKTIDLNFSQDSVFQNWFLEGSAHVSITPEQELLVEGVGDPKGPPGTPRGRYTLWYKQPVWGDVRFEMEIRGDCPNGNIWFFNAQPLKGHKSIFEWERPEADYVDYTGEDRMQLYSLGILRAHEEKINFRYIGGTNAGLVNKAGKQNLSAAADPDNAGLMSKDFEEKTVFHEFPSPFDDADRWYRLVIEVVGNRICASVDGREVMNYLDEAHAENPLRGGWFGFRSFTPTKTWCRKLLVSVRD